MKKDNDIWKEFPTNQDWKDARGFVESFGAILTVREFEGNGASGMYDLQSQEVILYKFSFANLEELWTAILHELSHHICCDEFILTNYHYGYYFLEYNEWKDYCKKYAWQCERFVDKQAKKLRDAYFPKMPYVSPYDDLSNKQWLEDYYA